MTVTTKVLVCDDDVINLDVVRELLQDDYEVATVESGAACLTRLSEFQPDVVLLDIMMPGLDGYETCRRIVAASNGSVPQIIFVSARASTQERLVGYEAGADDYVSKPFDHDELRAKVRIHVRLRRAIVELERAKRQIEAHSNNLERLVHERTTELQTAKEQLEDVARRLAASNVELAQLARLDPLTKLLNRIAWDEIADREQERCQRFDHPYSIVMIDIDHFKAYNDSQGHGAGDDCLRQVAQGIANRCRTAEFVGRYGGEEFVVLAPETDLEGGRVLAERIRAAIEELDIPHPASLTTDRVTVSVGVASGAGRSWEGLLREADAALYRAKKNGRNQICAAQTVASVAR
ncbi:MAG: diguanylate cyclase [Planctomycetes bacterium]|nr:diguanylate cyclase [Planctomycetota bacterium]